MKRRIVRIGATATVAILVAIGVFLAGSAYNYSHGTYCPTEDSCAYMYHDHRGNVVRIVP